MIFLFSFRKTFCSVPLPKSLSAVTDISVSFFWNINEALDQKQPICF